MSVPQKLALVSLAVGGILGLLVLAAARAAGPRPRLSPYFLAGSAWGTLSAGLMLTDCLHGGGIGPVSNAAFPVFFGGLVLWPPVLAWSRPRRFLSWLGAQAILLLALVPAFLVVVAAALCNLT